MGKVVVIGNKKGGVTKSITTINLAGVIANRGQKVLIIDGDENQTSNRYMARRELTNKQRLEDGLDALPHISVITKNPHEYIVRDIRSWKEMYDFVLIDTGGYINNVFKSSIGEADVIYLPFQPTKVDMEQLKPTIEAILSVEGDKRVVLSDDYRCDARLLPTLTDNRVRDLRLEARQACKSLMGAVSLSSCDIKNIKAVKIIQQDGFTLSDPVFTGGRAHPDRATYELLLDEIEGKRSVNIARTEAK